MGNAAFHFLADHLKFENNSPRWQTLIRNPNKNRSLRVLGVRSTVIAKIFAVWLSEKAAPKKNAFPFPFAAFLFSLRHEQSQQQQQQHLSNGNFLSPSVYVCVCVSISSNLFPAEYFF